MECFWNGKHARIHNLSTFDVQSSPANVVKSVNVMAFKAQATRFISEVTSHGARIDFTETSSPLKLTLTFSSHDSSKKRKNFISIDYE